MRGSLVAWLLLELLLMLEIDGGRSALQYNREDFPQDFVFGAGTSAYQVEGAAAEDGRSPCVWDTFTHAGKMPDKSTGDVASDGYHKYKEDVKLMTDTGLEAYRFSISWSRLLPSMTDNPRLLKISLPWKVKRKVLAYVTTYFADGRGALNPKGLEFYNNLINDLLKHGIQPHVTLYHLDLPQVLQDEYGGWLSAKIVDDFTAYADVCFREFGDRVSHWTTITEPNVIAIASYDTGTFPPGRCSYPFGINCMAGNSTTEPYIAVHNILLAHASAVKLYWTKYQAIQNGWIGLNVYSFWSYPFTNSTADIEAAQRALDFMIGWIMNPLVFGDYPEVMKKNAGSRLPLFTKNQSRQVKGSFDFIGLNHYFSEYVKDNSNGSRTGPRDFNADMFVKFTVSKNITPIPQLIPMGAPTDPRGLQYMLEYFKDAYENPPIYIQENGYGLGVFNSTLHDTARIDFLSGFIGSTLDAIRNGSDVRGYFVWSFLDVFEFLAGYTSCFGLYYVDFEDEKRERIPKLSAFWYSNFLKKKNDIKIERTGVNAKYNAQQ